MKDALDRIVKSYDIRGIVPDDLDAELAARFGMAFAQFWLEEDSSATQVLCGRDMRASGEELSQAFMEQIAGQGLDVLDLGIISTDMLYFASGWLDAPGVVFTASHNPAAYNGIKACYKGAVPIGMGTGLERVKELAAGVAEAGGSGDFGFEGVGSEHVGSEGVAMNAHRRSNRSRLVGSENVGSENVAPEAEPNSPASAQPKIISAKSGSEGSEISGRITRCDVLKEFVAHARSFVDLSNLKPLKIVVDCANGMGGLVAPAVFDGLAFETEFLYPELDGTFPNHPADPLDASNLVDLQERVGELGADAGIAFDGDGDRVFFIDEQGTALSGSTALSILAASVLLRNPGATVLYSAVCSQAVPEVITELGGKAVCTRVGHSHIKKQMAETRAAFGGEHSGHFYFSRNYRADSGIIAALVLLEHICTTGQPLSQLRQANERYAASGEHNISVPNPNKVIEHLAKTYSHHPQERIDGLTIKADTWRANIRPSNTEPLLRINIEAITNEDCAARLSEITNRIKKVPS